MIPAISERKQEIMRENSFLCVVKMQNCFNFLKICGQLCFCVL